LEHDTALSNARLRIVRATSESLSPGVCRRIFYCTVFTCWLSAPISLGHYDWLIGATEQGFSLVQVVFRLSFAPMVRRPLRAIRRNY